MHVADVFALDVSMEVDDLVQLLRNDCYMVRQYGGQRNETQRLRRRQAIRKLVATLQYAFKETEDYEAIIAAFLDGLRPLDRPPPF